MAKKQWIHIRWFEDLNAEDVSVVGGKNASLDEMIRALEEEGIRVPEGFATTVDAYWKFLEVNDLREQIQARLSNLASRKEALAKVGKSIRKLFLGGEFPEEITQVSQPG